MICMTNMNNILQIFICNFFSEALELKGHSHYFSISNSLLSSFFMLSLPLLFNAQGF